MIPSARPDSQGTGASTVVGGGENVRAITVPAQSNCTSARVAPAGKTSLVLLTSNLSHSPARRGGRLAGR